MAANSIIEWTDSTWNPVTGCTKASPGCKNCYAEKMAYRLKAMGQPNYINGFSVTLHENFIDTPLKWKRSQNIFVNSMSDLFHEDIPDEFIVKVFEIMNKADWHRFQILTKRSERLERINSRLKWSSNIWLGVSVENQDFLYRIDDLRQTGANVKFISFEPLLGSINKPDLAEIDWVIVGGESGTGARPMDSEWVKEIRDECNAASIPFFFKQWGGKNKKKAGRELDGRTWSEMPHFATF